MEGSREERQIGRDALLPTSESSQRGPGPATNTGFGTEPALSPVQNWSPTYNDSVNDFSTSWRYKSDVHSIETMLQILIFPWASDRWYDILPLYWVAQWTTAPRQPCKHNGKPPTLYRVLCVRLVCSVGWCIKHNFDLQCFWLTTGFLEYNLSYVGEQLYPDMLSNGKFYSSFLDDSMEMTYTRISETVRFYWFITGSFSRNGHHHEMSL